MIFNIRSATSSPATCSLLWITLTDSAQEGRPADLQRIQPDQQGDLAAAASVVIITHRAPRRACSTPAAASASRPMATPWLRSSGPNARGRSSRDRQSAFEQQEEWADVTRDHPAISSDDEDRTNVDGERKM